MQKIRTLVVDDDARFRQRVAALLAPEPDMEIIGEAATGEEAVRKAIELRPDVILMDVRMPEKNGLDATAQLKKASPRFRIIVLTIFDLDEYRAAAAAKGADAYIVKKDMIEELVPAIRNVAGG